MVKPGSFVFDVLQHAKVIYHLVYINLKEWKKTIRTDTIKMITVFTANQRTQENQIYNNYGIP
jgi:hypothetical protein